MTEEILKDIKTSLGLDDVDEAIPYINQCIQARDRILSDEYSDFKPGSLVLDTRDNEIGFVIGQSICMEILIRIVLLNYHTTLK